MMTGFTNSLPTGIRVTWAPSAHRAPARASEPNRRNFHADRRDRRRRLPPLKGGSRRAAEYGKPCSDGEMLRARLDGDPAQFREFGNPGLAAEPAVTARL